MQILVCVCVCVCACVRMCICANLSHSSSIFLKFGFSLTCNLTNRLAGQQVLRIGLEAHDTIAGFCEGGQWGWFWGLKLRLPCLLERQALFYQVIFPGLAYRLS